MSRMIRIVCIALLVALIGCNQPEQNPPVTLTTDPATAVNTEAPSHTTAPVATQTATAVPTPTLLPTPSASPIPPDLAVVPENIQLFPVPDIYAGEQVTFQIAANVPDHVNPQDVTVHVLVDYADVVTGTLDASNLQGDNVGLFQWAWDTTDQAGEHLIHVILDRYDTIQIGDENRDNNQASITVTIQEQAELSVSEQNAQWITKENNCCHVHVVSGTAAERDLDTLLQQVDTAVSQAALKLGEQPNRIFDVYIIDRILGQGGYAGYSIVVSHLDRNYAHSGLQQVMTHEAVHILDRQFAPERIQFLAEGVAVWASGGHYKPEDIRQRSAALVTIGQYVPLAQLIDNFYPVQHEIGYLEAAGFVTFLIDNYGWLKFREFYTDVSADDAPTLSQAVDMNLQKHFNITLETAETQWLDYLSQFPDDPTAVADLETTIRFYNVMRRYQQRHDPTAHFLTAWLPPPELLRLEGNPSDLTRHPNSDLHVTFEVMLKEADTAFQAGDYVRANILLDSVDRVLDNGGNFVDPLARNYYEVVQTAVAANYQVHEVNLTENRAVVKATKDNSVRLTNLTVILSGQEWVLWN